MIFGLTTIPMYMTKNKTLVNQRIKLIYLHKKTGFQ